jgi:hypothetical protein
MLGSEVQGMAIDFTSDAMAVRDTGTPANNFSGAPFSKLTFTRATIATRVNQLGFIEQVASGVPRIDYDPVSKACKGLLVETASTNLLLRSEEFDNASWTKGNILAGGANAITSPDGMVDGDAVIESTTAAAFHFINQALTKAASAITYTFSVFLKDKGRQVIIGGGDGTGTNGVNWRVNPATGATISAAASFGTGFTAVASNVRDFGNGWYRYELTFTTNSATNVTSQLAFHNGTTNVYTGDGISGVYAWGAQLEAMGFATSYIPTTSAAVTRNIEICQLATSAFPMGAGPWSFFVQAAPGVANPTTDANSHLPISFSSGAFAESTYISRLASSANISPSNVTGGAGNISVTAQASTYNTTFKAALGSATNNANWAMNGVTPSADDTVIALPVGLTRMSIGNADWSGGAGPTTVWGGWIEKIMVLPRRMTNLELQDLTSLTGGTSLAMTPPGLTWTTASSDNTPGFTGTLTDPLVDDTATLEWSTSSGFGTYDTSPNILDSGEIAGPALDYIIGTLADGTWYFRLRHSRAGYIDGLSVTRTVTISTVAVDTTAPTLSLPTAVAAGTDTVTGGATTNEGNGVLYLVASTSNTAPTAAQIIAGQMHTGAAAAGSGSVGVSSTGAKTLNVSGLTSASQYYIHAVHEDAAGNRSNVVTSAAVTTQLEEVFIGGDFELTAAAFVSISDPLDLSYAPSDSRRRLVTHAFNQGGAAATITSITLHPTATDATNNTNAIAGVSFSKIIAGGTAVDTASTNFHAWYQTALPTGLTTAFMRINYSAIPSRGGHRSVIHGRGAALSAGGNAPFSSGSGTLAAQQSGTIDVPSNGAALAGALATSGSTLDCQFGGMTNELYDALYSGTAWAAGAIFINDASAETAMAITSQWFDTTPAAAGSNTRLVAFALGARV